MGYQVRYDIAIALTTQPQLLIPFTDTRQWASFLAGCIGLVMSATPWILFRYGPAIRARVRCLFFLP